MADQHLTPPAGWVPAFPGQRPPFTPGHTLSTRHGAHSDRLVEPRALAIAEGLEADGALPDYLRDPSYRPAVLAYCRTLAQVERVEGYLASRTPEHGVPELDDDGAVRAATRLLDRLVARADRQRSDLGLTPMSRARLGRDVAAQQVSIWDVWERAAQVQAEGVTGEG